MLDGPDIIVSTFHVATIVCFFGFRPRFFILNSLPGSDIGGSIRMPAFYCGVFGHHPTPGTTNLKGNY